MKINPNDLLQEAIRLARAGRELTARDLFRDVIRLEPRNKLAWLWLIGLLDDFDEQIGACRRVLEIDPTEEHVQQRLDNLLAQRGEQIRTKARDLHAQGETERSLLLLRREVQDNGRDPASWLLLAELSRDVDEKARAYEQIVSLQPSDLAARKTLEKLRFRQQNPFDLPSLLEEQGRIDEAILEYQRAAARARTSQEWDHIYRNITRLEDLRNEGIVHISPLVSIARLSAGPPLLYLLSLLIHVGLNPLSADFIFWIGLAWSLLGGFLLALGTVRSRHRLWILLGDPAASGKPLSRFALRTSGWILVLLSFALLTLDALQRLAVFEVPPIPNYLQ
ncbi:MAG: tetratricopeptide repeat protein [Chloroflexota bacterium]